MKQFDDKSIISQFQSIINQFDISFKNKLNLQALPLCNKIKKKQTNKPTKNKEQKRQIIQDDYLYRIQQDFKQLGQTDELIAANLIDSIELNPKIEDSIKIYQWIQHKHIKRKSTIAFQEMHGVDLIFSSIVQYQHIKSEDAHKMVLIKILALIVSQELQDDEENIALSCVIESDYINLLYSLINKNQVEMSIDILNILDTISWTGAEGFQLVMEGFDHLKKNKQYLYRFQILKDLLNESKNAIFVLNICQFINSLCQAGKQEQIKLNIFEILQNEGFIIIFQVHIYFCMFAFKQPQQQEIFNKIKCGQYLVSEASFSKEDYCQISHYDLFYAANYLHRSENKLFYKKEEFQEFQYKLLQLFVSIHELQELNTEQLNQQIDILNSQVVVSADPQAQQKKDQAKQEKTNKFKQIVLNNIKQNSKKQAEFYLQLQEAQAQIRQQNKEIERLLKENQELKEKLQTEENNIRQKQNQLIVKQVEKSIFDEKVNEITQLKQEILKYQNQIQELEIAKKQDSKNSKQTQQTQTLQQQIKQLTSEKDQEKQKYELEIQSLKKSLSIPPPPPIMKQQSSNIQIPPPPNQLPKGPPPPPILGFPLLPPQLPKGPPPPPLIGAPPLPPFKGGPPLPPLIGGPPPLIGMPPPLIGGPPPLIGGPPPLGSFIGGMNQQVQKKKQNPGIPMKSVNWQILKYNELKSSIWENMKDLEIQLDEQTLKNEFSTKMTQSQTIGSKLVQQSNKKTTFLTSERQQNILILLGKIRIKSEQIVQAIIQFDTSVLTSNIVLSLLASLPQESESVQIQNYEGELDQLSEADKYFKLLIENVSNYEERLLSLKFKYFFSEAYREIITKIEKICEFFTQLPSDQNLYKILEYSLAIGNYLNGTGFKGGSWGFKIQSLDRIAEVKNYDNKLNLLCYIIQAAEEKEGRQLVLLNENLSNLEESSRTSINSLISDTSDTRKSLKILENVMKKKINEQDNIQSIIQPFYEEVKPQFHILENLLKKTEASFKKCAEYFCEDSRKIQSDEFSGFLYNFKKQCIDQKRRLLQMKKN